ncbi:MAG: hypothetical protein BWY77_00628 [bacterium ADurb.Bin431]|nr:MAG: hypothetical protein BWY77_00628 [bacterium ADurb.Bin431]
MGQEYVKFVPFSREVLPAESIQRLERTIPRTSRLIWKENLPGK